MIRFNNNKIITGYIKQLLKDFHLPKYRVLREDMDIFKDCIYISPKEDQYLLKGDINNTSIQTNTLYKWGREIVNITRNLKLYNNIYDSYTHEYLGDYLRFIRDSKNINLMSLYNCCSNVLDTKLNIRWEEQEQTKTFISSIDSELYKVYVIPAKYYENYTIGVDSDLGIEIIAGFYSNGNLLPSENGIYKDTYLRVDSISLNKPILYDKIKKLHLTKNLYLKEKDLKIFIKIPSKCKSSLVVLEGDFIDKDNIQLFYLNTNENYPFSNRLLEYIIGNIITPLDNIEENIQTVKQLTNPEDMLGRLTEQDREILYELIKEASKSNTSINNLDILGYYDKEAEALFRKEE